MANCLLKQIHYFQYNLFRFIDLYHCASPNFICLCNIVVLQTVHLSLNVWIYVGNERMLIFRKYLEMCYTDFAIQRYF
jgi:hypothetical protein